tara:strand:- start:24 stop:770 length:747 start_codon:yes stop_codon:yes gene_type:complete
METTSKIRSVAIWVFIVPFFAINICLVLSQIFVFKEFDVAEPGSYFLNYKIMSIGDAIADKASDWIIPYFDGVASISRVARVFPNYLIFKPAMFLTAFFLIRYWILNKAFIQETIGTHKDLNKIYYLGIGSAIFLIIHSIFLGIKFDISIYKLLRRIVLLLFIFFEIAAQFYLIRMLIEIKPKISSLINEKILFLKKILVYLLIAITIISLPFLPFDNFKILKHMLEWNFFLGVIGFYLLTFFMWKKK